MKEVKDTELHVITLDGYKAACFPYSADSKKALEIITNKKLDIAILGMPISNTDDLGFTLHIVTHKTTISAKRLAKLLVEEGKKNDLYWKHNGVQTEKSARVHCANLKLIE